MDRRSSTDRIGAPSAAGSVWCCRDPDAGVVLSRVGDDVAFEYENLGVPAEEIPARVRAALDAVGLDVPLDRTTAALSGGQKRRLALAGALAMRPGLFPLLDEPTANLDPDGVREIRASVERVVQATGATLVVIEHRTAVWADLMTRVIVVAPTEALADGTPAEVFGAHGDALADAGV